MKKLIKKIKWFWFSLFQSHRYYNLSIERINDFQIVVLPGVFNPTLFYSTELLIQSFDENILKKTDRVLDLGTGSGAVAIAISKFVNHVVATDLNPTAVRCCMINVLLNKLEGRIDVRCGDLFEPIKNEKFDVIIFNPPYYEGIPKNFTDIAWRGDTFQRFIRGFENFLNTDGSAILVLSTEVTNLENKLEIIKEKGYKILEISKKNYLSEVIYVCQIKK
jgi:release factor glutamine methyltransferase